MAKKSSASSQPARLKSMRSEGKRRVMTRVARVLAWLKSKGAGHLTRINDILTNSMEAERTPPVR